MKKRVVAVLLAMMLSVSMVACGSDSASDIKWSKYVTLVDYQGAKGATEEKINEEIDRILSSNATFDEVTGRPVEKGDVANIDYEGKKDGVPFDGGKAQGQDLEIGSGTFIPGFEDGLIGANIGETRDIELTFPQDYHQKDLAGQPVVFTVKVNAIKKPKKPELTDEFVQSISPKAKTVDEFKDELKKVIDPQIKWQAILDESQISKFPKGYLEKKQKEFKEYHKRMAKKNDQKFEDYLKSNFGLTEKEFDEKASLTVEKNAKQTAVIRAICEKEGIKLSDEEYKKEGEKYAKSVGAKSLEELEKDISKEDIENNILWQKVQQKLFGTEQKEQNTEQTQQDAEQAK